jgi:uncharacterized protein (DUF433 family)
MATQQYRIVSNEDSEIHGEPHIEGSRITVRDVYTRVEKRGLAPEQVAARYDLDIADIYRLNRPSASGLASEGEGRRKI